LAAGSSLANSKGQVGCENASRTRQTLFNCAIRNVRGWLLWHWDDWGRFRSVGCDGVNQLANSRLFSHLHGRFFVFFFYYGPLLFASWLRKGSRPTYFATFFVAARTTWAMVTTGPASSCFLSIWPYPSAVSRSREFLTKPVFLCSSLRFGVIIITSPGWVLHPTYIYQVELQLSCLRLDYF